MTTTPTFGVVYFCKDQRFHSTAIITAAAHWEACGIAWTNLPQGADDFQIVEDTATVAAGHEAIARAADALRSRRETCMALREDA